MNAQHSNYSPLVAFARGITRAGLSTLKTFRHTFATKQAENGLPINILTKLMGHKEIITTAKYYVGLTDQMIKQAVAILEEKTN